MKRCWPDRYWDRFYHSRPGWVDGTTEFWGMVKAHVKPGGTVLDFGCGPSNPTSRFLRETFGRLDGLDAGVPSPANEYVERMHAADGGRWPLPDRSYDAVVASYVAEHLADPTGAVREVFRVLRPGGVFLFRTPNLWHYVAAAARFSPHRVHECLANRLRGLADGAAAPYRSFYRMNTLRATRRVCRAAGLTEIETRMIEKDPSYGRSSRILFLLFMAYERIVNSTELLSFARANILGAWRKPQAREAGAVSGPRVQ